MNPVTAHPARNIMVLYTGGTIGMQASAHGLTPASGFEQRMREQLTAWRCLIGSFANCCH